MTETSGMDLTGKTDSLGIYILTYPKDYHLAKVLIRSIRSYHPDLPIMIVPGTGFDLNDHPFTDLPILHTCRPEWSDFEYYDRKFWVFDGPFERFIYLDSDMLCVRPFHSLLAAVKDQEKPFLYVNVEPHLLHGSRDDVTRRAKIESLNDAGQLGNLENLVHFDPAFDWKDAYPFNTGLFATSKSSFDADIFTDFRVRLHEFYETTLKCHYHGRCFKLFFGDQGQLVYLARKMNLNLISLYPDSHFVWGGDMIVDPVGRMLPMESDYTFIHWAGCPRPSPSLCNRGILFRIKLFLLHRDSGLRYSYEDQRNVPGLASWLRHCDETSILYVLEYSANDLLGMLKALVRRCR
jgi:hypothetical protein